MVHLKKWKSNIMTYDDIINIRLLSSFLSDQIVQVSLLFVLVVGISISYFASLVAGLLVLISYIGGVVTSHILWNRKGPSLSFATVQNYTSTFSRQSSVGCSVCGNSFCKRQKNIKDQQPWQGLNVPKEVDQAIQDLLNKILNEFVGSWYSSFTKDESFILELRRCLRYGASVLLRRTLEVDVGEIITDRLITTGFSHVNDFLSISELVKSECISVEAAAVRHLSDRLHPAVHSRETELQYLRGLCDCLSSYLLQSSQLECSSFRVLIREVLAGWVLLPLSDTLCDPFYINSLILLALSHEPLTQYPDNPSLQVQFLQRFITPNKDSTLRKSAIQYDLSVILKDQKLLFAFIQFLKKEGAVHILHFCLDVEEFNKKMLSPDLNQLDMDKLHAEAWGLFSVYFKTDSPDSIHFPKHIVQQMEQVLTEGAEKITRLRTTTPLFQAYEVAYALLDDIYCPLFHQSDEFFPLLCGQRLSSGYQKTSSSSLPGSPVKGRTNKRAGETSAVAKLSHKFHKLLQFQAVEGSAYVNDVTPLEIAEAECTEDSQIVSQPDSSYRDMSSWQVTIPSTTTRNDPSSKPYLIFNINVDIGSKGHDKEAKKIHWSIQRRYNDFYLLQSKLTEFHGEFNDGTQLPPKSGMFSIRGGEMLESRRQAFEEYIQKLLQNPNLRGSDLLQLFLTSYSEFSSSLTVPGGLGKMIRKSVEPIKLRKERGQHLDQFLANFLLSTEVKKSGKHEWQDVNIEPPRRKRCITNSIFKNNFSHVLGDSTNVPVTSSETLVLSGPWDCILYIITKLMGASLTTLQLAVTLKSLFGRSSDIVIKNYINKKLRTVLVPPRISHLVRLLQGALFSGSSSAGKPTDEAIKKKILSQLERPTKNMVVRWFLPKCYEGVETVIDTLQHPILNKHLCYCLLDEIIRVLFPELATSS